METQKYLTRDQVLQDLCRTVAMVHQSIGDWSDASDGFCNLCPNSDRPEVYRHTGETLKYVRAAVVEKLKRDGHEIARGFDPDTGEDLSPEMTTEELEKNKKHRQALVDLCGVFEMIVGPCADQSTGEVSEERA